MKLSTLILCALALLLAGCKTTEVKRPDRNTDSEAIRWQMIPAGDKPIPVKYFPSKNSGKSPSIFILHGTNGPDARGEHWAKFFNERGYNALIVDFKKGRFTGPADRLNVLPQPLIDYSLEWLTKQPEVNSKDISWMGLSYGAATGLMQEQNRWSSFILFYPGCWSFTKNQTPKPPRYWAYHAERPRVKPTLIVWGTEDGYLEGEYCPRMIELMSGSFEAFPIEGAHHGFDGELSLRFADGASPNGYSSLRPSKAARELAEKKIEEFLKIR